MKLRKIDHNWFNLDMIVAITRSTGWNANSEEYTIRFSDGSTIEVSTQEFTEIVNLLTEEN